LLSTQFGIDPLVTGRSLQALPRYLLDLARFRASYRGRIEMVPCLHDRHGEGGTSKSEYFWQDLLVARMVFEARPERHVDVGSRLDGFVAHVASFREIELLDIRPITTKIPGVRCRQADLMNVPAGMEAYCDSLSCLHALEHFGLGRYGDPLDPHGFERGLANLARLLRLGGVLYLSVPIGLARVEFNAHRVVDPVVLLAMASRNALQLAALSLIQQDGRVTEWSLEQLPLETVSNQRYVLGLFTFVKRAET
jgi:SAM-dependent methyltransferase